ncbi:MAG: IS1634 family transposase [Acidimicrobiales bacterium]
MRTSVDRAWIDPAALRCRTLRIGALPVVNAVLDRLGFDDLVAAYLPAPDARCGLAPAKAIGVMVRNLAVGRRPLYGLTAWAEGYEPGRLGLSAAETAALNDDKTGRALDVLFAADRASLLTALSLRVIRRYRLDVSELHNDSTSITLYGAYRDATGTARAGTRPPRPARGHSKDHRPDLKQLVQILTVAADGAVPLTYRLADGNTEDSTTHIDTWDTLVNLVGGPDFTYVADCKLATRDNMDHIAGRGGRFLTVLPRSRREDGIGRTWMASGAPGWEQVSRRPGRRKDAPDDIYWAAQAPACSAEGHRICWIRSSVKRADDAAARLDRIERARARLSELDHTLAAPRCQLKTRSAVEAAAAAILTDTGAARWVRAEVTDTVSYEHRQQKRGRPGKNTAYRRLEQHHFHIEAVTDADAVAFDAASDGCFPFITNTDAPAADLLRMYKAQPHLERRHATYKGVIEAAPVMLHNDARIDALSFCLYAALLVHALIERQLRQAMTTNGIPSLPLYYEDRACKAPTAARVFEILEPLVATAIVHDDQILTINAPTLDALQAQLLRLLKVPHSAYAPTDTAPRNSR